MKLGLSRLEAFSVLLWCLRAAATGSCGGSGREDCDTTPKLKESIERLRLKLSNGKKDILDLIGDEGFGLDDASVCKHVETLQETFFDVLEESGLCASLDGRARARILAMSPRSLKKRREEWYRGCIEVYEGKAERCNTEKESLESQIEMVEKEQKKHRSDKEKASRSRRKLRALRSSLEECEEKCHNYSAKLQEYEDYCGKIESLSRKLLGKSSVSALYESYLADERRLQEEERKYAEMCSRRPEPEATACPPQRQNTGRDIDPAGASNTGCSSNSAGPSAGHRRHDLQGRAGDDELFASLLLNTISDFSEAVSAIDEDAFMQQANNEDFDSFFGEMANDIIARSGLNEHSSSNQQFRKEDMPGGSKVQDCVICYDLLRPGREMIECVRHHRFHASCLYEWKEQGKQHCPSCRAAFTRAELNGLARYETNYLNYMCNLKDDQALEKKYLHESRGTEEEQSRLEAACREIRERASDLRRSILYPMAFENLNYGPNRRFYIPENVIGYFESTRIGHHDPRSRGFGRHRGVMIRCMKKYQDQVQVGLDLCIYQEVTKLVGRVFDALHAADFIAEHSYTELNRISDPEVKRLVVVDNQQAYPAIHGSMASRPGASLSQVYDMLVRHMAANDAQNFYSQEWLENSVFEI